MPGVWIPVAVYLCRQYSVWDETTLLAERAWATVCGLSEHCMGVFTSALLEPCRSDVIMLEPEIGSEIASTKRKLSVCLRSSSSDKKNPKQTKRKKYLKPLPKQISLNSDSGCWTQSLPLCHCHRLPVAFSAGQDKPHLFAFSCLYVCIALFF